ncbi:hypothetical protein RRG08_017112 [Elysia crispata]|uniref:Uncharacterized protein n=1 Tax=Elysia crispata TaxID=231223 RepID=A0AAE1DJY1_9GAST|nr:hypothetical protein RRG08_017112 [Elysia crispata]
MHLGSRLSGMRCAESGYSVLTVVCECRLWVFSPLSGMRCADSGSHSGMRNADSEEIQFSQWCAKCRIWVFSSHSGVRVQNLGIQFTQWHALCRFRVHTLCSSMRSIESLNSQHPCSHCTAWSACTAAIGVVTLHCLFACDHGDLRLQHARQSDMCGFRVVSRLSTT